MIISKNSIIYDEQKNEYVVGERIGGGGCSAVFKIKSKKDGQYYALKTFSSDFEDETENDSKLKGLKETTSNVYGNGHTSLFADMIDAIHNDRIPYVDAIAGRNALEIVLAIYKSQKTGIPVKFPLRDFSSSDMKGEFKINKK